MKKEKRKLSETHSRVDEVHKESRHCQLQSRKRCGLLCVDGIIDGKRSRKETRKCKVQSEKEINIVRNGSTYVGPCSLKCKTNHNRASKQDGNKAEKHSKCMETVKIINPVELDGTVIAQGSFHQGDRRFGDNSGKQCVANCLASMMYSMKKDVRN